MNMDLLLKTGMFKLRSHLDKFLVADEDKEKIRQSKNGSSKRAIWVVEPSPNNPNTIRVRNFQTGLYITASDNPFLLGMTGKRVVQLSIFDPTRVEWEPINDGFLIKLKSNEGSYLRANGGTPPWRNSVTHDVPLVGGSYNWILWEVEPVLVTDIGSGQSGQLSPMSSFNSSVLSSDEFDGSYPSSPLPMGSSMSKDVFTRMSSMDLFSNAKAVRLRSHHDKYLTAEDDEESVTQDRNGSTRNSKWEVEFVESGQAIIRLKSCYGKYLTASNQPFLLGMTGRKVTQTRPKRLDSSSVEWEPVRDDGGLTRIRTRYGNFLRANGGLPPWRNSVTHDVPHRSSTQDWILWEVQIVEILDHNDGGDNVGKVNGSGPVNVSYSDSFGSESSSVSNGSGKFQRQESSDSGIHSPVKKPDGRLIYYHVADEFGDVNEAVEGNSFTYKGHSVSELSQKLGQETGLQDIIICSRSPLNGKLYPLRLQLPPNNATMHIVVVPSTSKLSREFSKMGIL